MTPNSCTFCGAHHSSGYLFGDSTLRICHSCRDSILTYLDSLGIVIADDHPFVRELCENCHYVDQACWRFYNSRTGLGQDVLRLRKD